MIKMFMSDMIIVMIFQPKSIATMSANKGFNFKMDQQMLSNIRYFIENFIAIKTYVRLFIISNLCFTFFFLHNYL